MHGLLFFALTAAAAFVPVSRVWQLRWIVPRDGQRIHTLPRVDAPHGGLHLRSMSTLAEIEKAIEQLPPETFRELRQWIAKRDWKQWDAQIEADAAAGRLDALREKVRADYAAGNCTEF